MTETATSTAALAQFDRWISCVSREIQFRHRVYPALITRGKMTAETAAREIDTMGEVLAYLQGQRSAKVGGGA